MRGDCIACDALFDICHSDNLALRYHDLSAPSFPLILACPGVQEMVLLCFSFLNVCICLISATICLCCVGCHPKQFLP